MWQQFAYCNCYIDVAWLLPKSYPLCFCPRFVLLFSFYGLIMGLQSFGINIYLTQVLFTTVDLPFYFLGFLTTKSLGCKHTQMGSLLLSGNFILTCAMIPLVSMWPISAPVLVLSQVQFPIWPKPTTWKGMKKPSLLQTFPNTLSLPLFVPDQVFLRIAMALLGKGCLTGPMNCLLMYTVELYPIVMQWVGVLGRSPGMEQWGPRARRFPDRKGTNVNQLFFKATKEKKNIQKLGQIKDKK